MDQDKIVKIHPVNGAVNGVRTLHQCFLALGAAESEIYTGGNGYKRRGWQKLRERYCREELLEWARRLYIRAMKAIHPDHGGDCNQAATVNLAYERVQHILNYEKKRLFIRS